MELLGALSWDGHVCASWARIGHGSPSELTARVSTRPRGRPVRAPRPGGPISGVPHADLRALDRDAPRQRGRTLGRGLAHVGAPGAATRIVHAEGALAITLAGARSAGHSRSARSHDAGRRPRGGAARVPVRALVVREARAVARLGTALRRRIGRAVGRPIAPRCIEQPVGRRGIERRRGIGDGVRLRAAAGADGEESSRKPRDASSHDDSTAHASA